MGLFSKTEYVCAICGRTYKKSFSLMEENLCNSCKPSVEGYRNYALMVHGHFATGEMINAALMHREEIIRKYMRPNPNLWNDLKMIDKQFVNWTQEQKMAFCQELRNSQVKTTIGSTYNAPFFISTQFDGLILDAADVFAVAIGQMGNALFSKSKYYFLCFTNDPYIPLYPMVFDTKDIGPVIDMFLRVCPNLTYPISDFPVLLATVQHEGMVKGNISVQNMVEYGKMVLGKTDPIIETQVDSGLLPKGEEVLRRMGYRTEMNSGIPYTKKISEFYYCNR